jgi:hypothetical protein
VLPVRARVAALVDGAPVRADEPAWIATRLRGARTADERWDRVDRLLVELDIADAAMDHVEQVATAQQAVLVDNSGARSETIMILDEEHHDYEFDGAWWPDELANYRVPLRSRCERR